MTLKQHRLTGFISNVIIGDCTIKGIPTRVAVLETVIVGMVEVPPNGDDANGAEPNISHRSPRSWYRQS